MHPLAPTLQFQPVLCPSLHPGGRPFLRPWWDPGGAAAWPAAKLGPAPAFRADATGLSASSIATLPSRNSLCMRKLTLEVKQGSSPSPWLNRMPTSRSRSPSCGHFGRTPRRRRLGSAPKGRGARGARGMPAIWTAIEGSRRPNGTGGARLGSRGRTILVFAMITFLLL
jgi:hypothetical protein